MILKSSAFKPNETIPQRFTCDGDNINPLLEIRDAPQGTKSLVLIIDDPDATNGITWDHWVIFNIDPKTQYISEDSVPFGTIIGKNSWGTNRYGGPCPPKGSSPHHYTFKLYAIDKMLDLKEGATKSEIEKVIEGHTLEKATLIGLYSRK